MARIYIAGGFYGSYKETIQRWLCPQHVLLDPEIYTDAEERIPARYVQRDLDEIEDSDILLAVQTDYPYVYGMAAEVGYAAGYVRGHAECDSDSNEKIDVIYVCLTKRVDGFLSGLARATFTDLEAACRFINERY